MVKTLKELQAEAIKLGIAFDGRWGKKKLKEMINKNLLVSNNEQAIFSFYKENDPIVDNSNMVKPVDEKIIEKKIIKIKNISDNKYEILGFSIKPLEVVKLSDNQMDNANFMKRINRHVEIKKFKIVK